MYIYIYDSWSILDSHESNLRFIFFQTDSVFLPLKLSRKNHILALTFKIKYDTRSFQTSYTKLD